MKVGLEESIGLSVESRPGVEYRSFSLKESLDLSVESRPFSEK